VGVNLSWAIGVGDGDTGELETHRTFSISPLHCRLAKNVTRFDSSDPTKLFSITFLE